jgi:hypothetical protein
VSYGLSAIETALPSNQLSAYLEGFSNTGDFIMDMEGETWYTFGDNPEKLDLKGLPYLMYISERFAKPYLADYVHEHMEGKKANFKHILWYVPKQNAVEAEKKQDRLYSGEIEMLTMRNKDRSVYVAAKAGYNQFNHNHLDLGSFVLDAKEERWVEDLRMKYLGTDSFKLKGIWNGGEGGKRWDYFITSTFGHSTLLIDSLNQNAYARAKILDWNGSDDSAFVVIDMSGAYMASAEKVVRSITFRKKTNEVIIHDKISLKEGRHDVISQFISLAKLFSYERQGLIINKNDKSICLRNEGDGRIMIHKVFLEPSESRLEFVNVIQVAAAGEGNVDMKVRFLLD